MTYPFEHTNRSIKELMNWTINSGRGTGKTWLNKIRELETNKPGREAITTNNTMADLNHTTKKRLMAELETARGERRQMAENYTTETMNLRDELKRTKQRLDDMRSMFYRADKDAGIFAKERDQARAALQALALSNGRLTEHMDSKKLVMSATDSCTPR